MDLAPVSIVVPVYNRPKGIVRAVRSVTSQSYRNLEVVVVDDASKDNTQEVVRGLTTEDPRVKLICSPTNGGPQRARNIGIRAARGDWIGFLDSDDWYLPGSLELRVRRVLEENADCVYSDCILRLPDGSERVWGLPALSGRVYRALLRRWGPMYQSLLVRRAALERIGLLDESVVSCQEWDTSIRLSKDHTFAFVPEPTYVWDCTTPVTQTKNLRAEAIGYEQVVRKHEQEILRELGRSALYAHYRTVVAKYGRAGGLLETWRCWGRWTAFAGYSPGPALRYALTTAVLPLRHCYHGWFPEPWRRRIRAALFRKD